MERLGLLAIPTGAEKCRARETDVAAVDMSVPWAPLEKGWNEAKIERLGDQVPAHRTIAECFAREKTIIAALIVCNQNLHFSEMFTGGNQPAEDGARKRHTLRPL